MQGMEKLNDMTTIDFAKSTNYNYRNLEALKQIVAKRNRVTHLQDCGCEQTPKKNTCSKYCGLGHSKRKCGETTHS